MGFQEINRKNQEEEKHGEEDFSNYRKDFVGHPCYGFDLSWNIVSGTLKML
jgi:hypothetical protein